MSRPHTLKLIWKGMSRRRSRTYAAIVCFAIITASLLSSSILLEAAGTSVSVGLDRMGADLAIVPQEYSELTNSTEGAGGSMSMGGSGPAQGLTLFVVKPVPAYLNTSDVDRVRGLMGVAQASPQLCVGASAATYNQVIGFDPDTDFAIQPWVHGGSGKALKSGEALVGSLVSSASTASLDLFGQRFNITQRLDSTGTSVDRTVFMRLDDLYGLARSNDTVATGTLEGQISAIMVKRAPGTDQEALATSLTAEMPGTTTIASSRLASNLADQFMSIGSSLTLAALIVTAVVVPQVALVTTMVSNERRGEYGMLRALGGTKRFVFGLVIGETLVIALIGGLIGVASTGLIFMIIERQLGTAVLGPFLWPSAGAMILDVAVALSAALLVGALSALYPAYSSSKRDPYEAIRKGGGR